MLALNRGGVRRLCVGHTPHGISPTIIKSGGPGICAPCVEVVMADTSFSDMSAPDNRGDAVFEVQVLEGKQLRVHGVLPKGKLSADLAGGVLDFTLEEGVGPNTELVGMEQPVGTMDSLTDGKAVFSPESERYFIKAKCPDEHYLACHVRGFIYKYNKLDAGQAAELVNPEGVSIGPLNQVHRRSSTLVSCAGDHSTQGLPHEYSESRKALIGILFKDLDSDGNQRISRTELHDALIREGSHTLELLHIDQKDMGVATDCLMKALDANGDGYITREELQDFFHKDTHCTCECVRAHTLNSPAIPFDLFLSRGFVAGVAASILVHGFCVWMGFNVFESAAHRIRIR